VLWFGLKSVEYTGELRDFNTPTFKLIFSISGLVTQAWIIYEFFKRQNADGVSLSASFGLLKSKPKAVRADNANKKRKNAGVCTLLKVATHYSFVYRSTVFNVVQTVLIVHQRAHFLFYLFLTLNMEQKSNYSVFILAWCMVSVLNPTYYLYT